MADSKHPFHKVILAWLAGKVVQVNLDGGPWSDCKTIDETTSLPSFSAACGWRIKPEIKKYTVVFYRVGATAYTEWFHGHVDSSVEIPKHAQQQRVGLVKILHINHIEVEDTP